ncbi:hypothetical protein G7Y79_00004g015290 [Physcia stellaris]|nr:hypothetical protein G7Y79_00004g015290 [Physcia stellaris]
MPGLLDLPLELRNLIYSHLPRTWRFTDVPAMDPWSENENENHPTIADHLEYSFSPAILRVNKQISAEAHQALYARNVFYFELVGGRPSYAPMLLEWPALHHLRNVNIQFWEVGGEEFDARVLRRQLEEICAVLSLAPSLERVIIALYDWRRFGTGDTFAELLERRRKDWRAVLEPLASLPEQLTWELETPIVVAWDLKGDGGRIVAEAVGKCVADIMGRRGAEKKEL